MNDLLTINCNGRISAFADDIALIYSDIKAYKSIRFNNDVLENWCISNMSIKKYHDLTFKTQITCWCLETEGTDYYKYLGIYLDEIMGWEKHPTALNNQITSMYDIS